MTKPHPLVKDIIDILDDAGLYNMLTYFDEINLMLEFADMAGYQRHKKQLELIKDD